MVDADGSAMVEASGRNDRHKWALPRKGEQDARSTHYRLPLWPRCPVTWTELRELEATVGFADQDRVCLQRLGALIREDDAAALVDGGRKLIGAQPHLARWFFAPDGKPDKAQQRPP
jgi:hypothetical protein